MKDKKPSKGFPFILFPHDPTKMQRQGNRSSQFSGTNHIWNSGVTAIRLFEGGSSSYKGYAETQNNPRPLALPGPRLLQQAPGKASEEAVSWATGHAVVHQRHQSLLSTQLPLQLMQSCLVSALRVGTESSLKEYSLRIKAKPLSIPYHEMFLCICFHFLSLSKKEEDRNNLLPTITTFRDVYRSQTSLDVCQLLNRSCFSCQIYPLFFSAYK